MAQPGTQSPTGRLSVGSVIRRYRGQRWTTRAYLQLRRVVVPLDVIERQVPESGRILDACCGHGALTMLLALRGERREVLGIDIDRARIAIARSAAEGLPRVRFEVEDLLNLEETNLQAIVLVDALHYFDRRAQLTVLRKLRGMLAPNGLLLCRDAVREAGPRFWWNWAHERVMVGLAFTATRDRSSHFLSLAEFTAQMHSAGFRVESVERTRPWLPYTDRLFIARTR